MLEWPGSDETKEEVGREPGVGCVFAFLYGRHGLKDRCSSEMHEDGQD